MKTLLVLLLALGLVACGDQKKEAAAKDEDKNEQQAEDQAVEQEEAAPSDEPTVLEGKWEVVAAGGEGTDEKVGITYVFTGKTVTINDGQAAPFEMDDEKLTLTGEEVTTQYLWRIENGELKLEDTVKKQLLILNRMD